MTSADTQALIEEARDGVDGNAGLSYVWLRATVRRLADALEAEMAARCDLTDKIEALEQGLPWSGFTAIADDYQRGYRHAQDDIKRELRGLVSGDKEEQR